MISKDNTPELTEGETYTFTESAYPKGHISYTIDPVTGAHMIQISLDWIQVVHPELDPATPATEILHPGGELATSVSVAEILEEMWHVARLQAITIRKSLE